MQAKFQAKLQARVESAARKPQVNHIRNHKHNQSRPRSLPLSTTGPSMTSRIVRGSDMPYCLCLSIQRIRSSIPCQCQCQCRCKISDRMPAMPPIDKCISRISIRILICRHRNFHSLSNPRHQTLRDPKPSMLDHRIHPLRIEGTCRSSRSLATSQRWSVESALIDSAPSPPPTASLS